MFRRQTHSQNYYSNRGSELRSRRALSNKFQIIKKLAFKLCVVFLFGGIIYAILFSSVLAVKNIAVEGNKAINSNEIKEIILSLVSQKKWKIFNNNVLLISAADAESAIRNRFGNIDTVRIEKKFPQGIKVFIKEKSADIAWCNKIIVEKIKNVKNVPSDEVLPGEIPQCYLSDEEGIIYEKIGDNVAGDSVKVFRDEPIEMKSKISDENLKKFIRTIFYNFNGKTGLSLNYLYMLPPASRELHLATNENLKIYFDLNRDADGQLSDLAALVKDATKKNDDIGKNYEYVDLRIVDRIIVKLKPEVKK